MPLRGFLGRLPSTKVCDSLEQGGLLRTQHTVSDAFQCTFMRLSRSSCSGFDKLDHRRLDKTTPTLVEAKRPYVRSSWMMAWFVDHEDQTRQANSLWSRYQYVLDATCALSARSYMHHHP